MLSSWTKRAFRLALAASLGLSAAGCAFHTDSYAPSVLPEIPGACAPAPAPVPGEPLGLDQFISMAESNHPDLAVALARTDAARGHLLQGGLYPNPTFTWEADEVGSNTSAAGTQGPILSQTIVTARKLRLASAAARAGVAAADWQTMTRWFEVISRVRLAYFEVLTARAEVQAGEEILKLAEDGLGVVRKLQKAGIAAQPDILRAEVELEQTQMRLRSAQQRAKAAWKLLASSVGIPDLPLAHLTGTLEGNVPDYQWEPAVRKVLTHSSELQEAEALASQSEQLVRRALAERVPDLKVSVRPFYSYIDKDTQVKIEAGAELPLFNRNQGNIATARAGAERARNEVRQVELRLTDRLSVAFQRYRDARQQSDAYQKKILPSAVESLRLVRRGYERGDARYDYTAVLQAQQTLAQARLAYVQALGNLWRAVIEIAGLVQEPLAGHP
jgi:cobalt-zinc-cadmium efflux system outer membrane protein